MAAITTAVAVGGLALSAAGAYGQYSAGKDASASQQAMIAEQQKQERIRKRAMELDAQRKTMEVIRTQQRARALALTNATAQNAGQGSGLQGGYGQIAGQSGTNLTGINTALQTGRQMFASNMNMTTLQGQYADSQSTRAMWSGIGSMGSSFMGSASTIGNIFAPGASGGGASTSTWLGGNANPYMTSNAAGWA